MTEKKELEFGDKVNVAILLMRGYQTCFTPFLRYKMGTEALGINGVVAFAIQVIYVQATQDVMMLRGLGFWCLLVVLQRIDADKSAHSMFEGNMFLTRLFRCIRSEGWGRVIEACLMVLWGLMLMHDSTAFGKFWVGGGIVMLMMYRVDAFAVSRRLRQMQDQEIEMRGLHIHYDSMKRRR